MYFWRYYLIIFSHLNIEIEPRLSSTLRQFERALAIVISTSNGNNESNTSVASCTSSPLILSSSTSVHQSNANTSSSCATSASNSTSSSARSSRSSRSLVASQTAARHDQRPPTTERTVFETERNRDSIALILNEKQTVTEQFSKLISHFLLVRFILFISFYY